jgi:SET domain-containing protein
LLFAASCMRYTVYIAHVYAYGMRRTDLCHMAMLLHTKGEIIRNPVADKREKLYADMQVTDIFNHLHFVSCLLVSVEL